MEITDYQNKFVYLHIPITDKRFSPDISRFLIDQFKILLLCSTTSMCRNVLHNFHAFKVYSFGILMLVASHDFICAGVNHR